MDGKSEASVNILSLAFGLNGQELWNRGSTRATPTTWPQVAITYVNCLEIQPGSLAISTQYVLGAMISAFCLGRSGTPHYINIWHEMPSTRRIGEPRLHADQTRLSQGITVRSTPCSHVGGGARIPGHSFFALKGTNTERAPNLQAGRLRSCISEVGFIMSLCTQLDSPWTCVATSNNFNVHTSPALASKSTGRLPSSGSHAFNLTITC